MFAGAASAASAGSTGSGAAADRRVAALAARGLEAVAAPASARTPRPAEGDDEVGPLLLRWRRPAGADAMEAAGPSGHADETEERGGAEVADLCEALQVRLFLSPCASCDALRHPYWWEYGVVRVISTGKGPT